MCLYPRLIDNPKYKANQKNGGVIPPLKDCRVKYVPVGCGTCIECRKQKTREWMTRLQEDIKEHKNGKFITLTYSTESLRELVIPRYRIMKHSKVKFAKAPRKQPRVKYKRTNKNLQKLKGYDLDNAIVIKSVRLFLERWRKKFGKSLRHWLVSELGHGETEHVHIHGIIWTDNMKELDEIWKYGKVWKGHEKNGKLINYVNAKTINYITKYITKIDSKHLGYQSIILTSQGIGKNYTKTYNASRNKYNGTQTRETYRTEQGYKITLPIYWRNKIYTEKEREELWIQKIDKGIRYVCGEKVKSDNDKLYYNLLMYHRERSNKLGYRSPDFIWKAKQYEERRRTLMNNRRLKENPQRKKQLSLYIQGEE